MIILLVVLGAGAVGAVVLGALWTQVHPVAAVVVGLAAAVITWRRVSRATDPATPTVGSAARKHDQFLTAWTAAGHTTDPTRPAAAWRADHAATGIDAAEWIARHHPDEG